MAEHSLQISEVQLEITSLDPAQAQRTQRARQTAASAPTRQPNAQTRTLQTARGKRVLQTRGLS
jgi:hypothetical protein